MGARFTRRTVVAAIEVLERLNQAKFSRLLLTLGPDLDAAVGDGISLTNRLNDLIRFVDRHPDHTLEGGEPLVDALVEHAIGILPPPSDWTEPKPDEAAFRRSLLLEGYVVADGALKRTLPADIGVPEAEDEITRLLAKHGMVTTKGHLDEALKTHTDGHWAATNSQIRTFLDSLLDEIAVRLDPTAAALGTGHPRRTRLAALGFLGRDLNEWDDDGRGFVNGLVKRLHPRGPHPGLSDDEDCTFRLNVVLLTARLFLVRFDSSR